MTDVNNPQQFYGKGMGHFFPEGSSDVRPVPFPRAGRSKNRADYDREVVHRELNNPPRPVQMDPRMLHATQPSVTRPGVSHYASADWEVTGRLYADHAVPVNRFPVVYSRFNAGGDKVEHMLLSGHHRATEALLAGKDLTAIHIEGPWGEERKK